MAKLKKKPKAIEEELVVEEEQSSTLESFISSNLNIILGVLGVVVLGLVGFFYLDYSKAQENVEANENMFQSIKYFEADSLDKALNGDGNGLGLLAVEEDYSGTDAANQAKYYIGIIYLKQGRIEEGVEYLEDFDEPSNTLLAMSSYMAQGFGYEDLGNPEKAASYFQRAASAVGENDHTTPTMLLNAGRNYEAAGQFDKALNVYQTIKKDFPTSSEGFQIDKYIGRVTR